MIYTPPQYSDHIAVSLVLGRGAVAGVAPPAKFDAATRKCQPHAATTAITSFFGKAGPQAPKPADGATAATGADAAGKAASKKRAADAEAAPPPAKGGIKLFFKK